MKSFGQGLFACSGRRALPYADLKKAFGQRTMHGIFEGLPSRAGAGPLPLIKGDSYFDSRVKRGNGSALTALQACLIGLHGNTGRCPVLCSLRAYSPNSQCGIFSKEAATSGPGLPSRGALRSKACGPAPPCQGGQSQRGLPSRSPLSRGTVDSLCARARAFCFAAGASGR